MESLRFPLENCDDTRDPSIILNTSEELRDSVFDYKLRLKEMEMNGPSLRHWGERVYDQIGVDFMINQPHYHLRS